MGGQVAKLNSCTPEQLKAGRLVVMTLNLQYFASFPKDAQAAKARLQEALGGACPPDVICVQEGLEHRDILSELGFELVVCTGRDGVAQSVSDMVYADDQALGGCDPANHDMLLCNQIYVRRNFSWSIADWGVEQISSDLQLTGSSGRSHGKLAVRSMAWVKLRSATGPFVYVMCTHISGGRFEDQYFAQQLSEERRLQTERALNFFHARVKPNPDDIGILVGDFNATTEYGKEGPMHSYFKAAIANSSGVQADASVAGLQNEQEIEELFKTYMVSPFTAIKKHGWTLAYDQHKVGPTSGFGHLVDHMATSRPLEVVSAEPVHFTNQKFGNKPKDTDLPLTDHNAVRTVFSIPASAAEEANIRSSHSSIRSPSLLPDLEANVSSSTQLSVRGAFQRFLSSVFSGPLKSLLFANAAPSASFC
mmetsp:Transcript_35515/g.64406  ORF Transcript_35515/g.64406 Transcript_35515/m.64406 type:complete len:421 (+) Transcript_35515:87-1349(+)